MPVFLAIYLLMAALKEAIRISFLSLSEISPALFLYNTEQRLSGNIYRASRLARVRTGKSWNGYISSGGALLAPIDQASEYVIEIFGGGDVVTGLQH
jgi:hypothetical protein